MRLKINRESEFNKGWKQAVIAQVRLAIETIEELAESDPHECVHEIRKAFKKIRGALRLVRFHIDHYKESNVFFRDLGREVSDIRDATSIIETVDEVAENYKDQLSAHRFGTIRENLETRRSMMAEKAFQHDHVLQNIHDTLQRKLPEIENWSLDIQQSGPLVKGIKKTYKRGYKGLEESIHSGKAEDFHEWRKRAKYLRYQLQLMEHTWPEMIETMEDELHKVTDDVGLDHDLVVTSRIIKEEMIPFEDPLAEAVFFKLADHRRSILQQRAIHLGKRFYALKPKRFSKLLGEYWEISRSI